MARQDSVLAFGAVVFWIDWKAGLPWTWLLGEGPMIVVLGVAILVFDPAVVHELPGIALTVLASAIWAISSLIQRNLKGVPVMTMACMSSVRRVWA